MLDYVLNGFQRRKKKIDYKRLKGEINALSNQLRFLKSRYRDPELNQAIYRWLNKGKGQNDKTREFSSVCVKRFQKRQRFNKLITLKALMRGKIHFHKNTNFYHIDYHLVKLGRFPTKDDLWDWVKDVREEFEVE